MRTPSISIGREAENRAARFLESRGLRIIARNARYRGGEIDLIADDGGVLVFIEVRARASNRFGGAGASITATKQGRIILAAQHYLLAHPAAARRPCRFDAVLIGETGSALDWIRDAFQAS
jgi:putative endonuclease